VSLVISDHERAALAELARFPLFAALTRLYAAGIPVPYPAQILGTELLLEFIGAPDGTAAPRLAETRPGRTPSVA